ncbi:ABC transporter ATP-binding protein [Rhizobium sp. SEMIA 4085]|uniref:Nickel/oligopeptide ABC transporter ATP-binding protein n=1 Tax=Rhizobium gallicum bv. gallicum R602sp TaxID=1041138 RepID=A0A0B4X9T3_9HYPH|nr:MULTISPECIES: ABC transporter ATP-binding protein [Rhizobium]TDW16885.1 peptide/nickel transport system ATP-binding protein [Rhizobium azibense]AJD43881.1 nickel/oligopeptide ABC transporter ATP-binding protein [Rhizobium gallicum bv. gallicum R602sp]AJD43908.1 nickel/oligopeptide ABC transporter ATP-binding protein [Rhizobium gallicum bv. gallicum R602sp]NNH32223.1 ABC transporter ATP-binding protein [Rhizobium sp. SEMIA 4085]TDW16909.1 peptide/nickel transport system ATP-binding protein [
MQIHQNVGNEVLLDVRDLETHFFGEDSVTRALGGISFQVMKGETLGVVGESGCGKSVTALSILRLLPKLTARTIGGEVRFHGRDLLDLSEREMRKIRGDQIAMIFQDPMTSLNPVYTVGHQIAEAVQIHTGASRAAAMAKAEEMLRLVRIADPERRANNYPHEMSGGMRQRAMIAMALACSPELLIADEPTTALDVTIQAQILRLIVDLKERTGTAVMFITHDLGVVAETCQRVIVMYAGRIVEQATVTDLFARPAHPYTQALMRSVPDRRRGQQSRLPEIPGIVPSLRNPIVGCSFAPRCPFAIDICREKTPVLKYVGPAHAAACWRAEEVMGV